MKRVYAEPLELPTLESKMEERHCHLKLLSLDLGYTSKAIEAPIPYFQKIIWLLRTSMIRKL